jgi:leucyl aminopeptidase
MHPNLAINAKNGLDLHAVCAKDAKAWLEGKKRAGLVSLVGFGGAAGELVALCDRKGAIAAWVLGLGKGGDRFALAEAAEKLPAGLYRLGEVAEFCGGAWAALGWLMGCYNFDRYKKRPAKKPRLLLPAGVDGQEISRIAQSLFLARDLVNTPANDMGPAELEAATRGLARRHGAKVSVVSGAMLAKNYPLIAAVGGGSPRAPRLIELLWGKGPLVTLVGKGVCFDSGGLDLKPSAAMLTMKKDMGGAACVLAVAAMAMGAGLKLRLRVLIPATSSRAARA